MPVVESTKRMRIARGVGLEIGAVVAHVPSHDCKQGVVHDPVWIVCEFRRFAPDPYTEAMTDALWLILGAAIGAVVAWLAATVRAAGRGSEAIRVAQTRAAEAGARLDEVTCARDEVVASIAEERSARQVAESGVARLQAELEGERRNLLEQRKQFEDARAQLTHEFRSIGAEALQQTQKQFIESATQTLAGQQRVASAELEQRRQAIDASLKPMRELLERQQQSIGELEQRRVAAYSSLETQIKGMLTATDAIRTEAGKLTNALQRSDARGRWGEVALRNLVEMAGMHEHVDFETQVHVKGVDANFRPDMVVRLPGGGCVVVDAKVPLDAYLRALEATSDRDGLMREHANAVKGHVDALSAKQYWDQFAHTPSYVVMFVPVESALAAALGARPELQEYALRSKVILASSGIFLGLLQTVSLFWRQERLAENARAISDAGADLYDRLAVFAGHMTKLGEAVANTTKHFNSAIGSMESRVLPAARTMRELHATTKGAIEAPPLIDVEPRRIGSEELRPKGSAES